MLPPPPFRLKSRLAGGAAADPHDALKARKALSALGFPTATKFVGPTGFTDTALDHSVRRFQSANRLTPDGVINPDGPTANTIGRRLIEQRRSPTPSPPPRRKTILTGLDPSTPVAPRTPPGKPNTGTRINPTAGLPRQGQARTNPVTRSLEKAVQTALASNEVHSENARMVKAAVRKTDHRELARSHAFAVSEYGDDAVGELVDFGRQLVDAEPESFASWVEAMASETWGTMQQILTAMFWTRSAAPGGQAASSPPPPNRSDDPRQIYKALAALHKKRSDNAEMPSAILLKRIIDGSRDTAARAIVAARDAAEAEAQDSRQTASAAEQTGGRPDGLGWGASGAAKGTRSNKLNNGEFEIAATSTPSQPKLPPKLHIIRQLFHEFDYWGRMAGLNYAPKLGRHFIDGTGTTYVIPAPDARKAYSVIEGTPKVKGNFRKWFSNEIEDSTLGYVSTQIGLGDPYIDLKNLRWQGSGKSVPVNWEELEKLNNQGSLETLDAILAFGGATVTGIVIDGGMTERPNGNYTIDMTVDLHVTDNFNFDQKGSASKYILGFLPVTRKDMNDLENAGGAKRFQVKSEPWRYHVFGTIEIDNGAFIGSTVTWDEIK